MSKSKTTAAAPAMPYPERGGSFILDEAAAVLTPVPTLAETDAETAVQVPVESTPEQEPQ